MSENKAELKALMDEVKDFEDLKNRYEELYGKRGEEEEDFEKATVAKDTTGKALAEEIKRNIKDISANEQ